jgi:hypothetical protein
LGLSLALGLGLAFGLARATGYISIAVRTGSSAGTLFFDVRGRRRGRDRGLDVFDVRARRRGRHRGLDVDDLAGDERLMCGRTSVVRHELADRARDSPNRHPLHRGILTQARVVIRVPTAQAQEQFLWKATISKATTSLNIATQSLSIATKSLIIATKSFSKATQSLRIATMSLYRYIYIYIYIYR